MADSGFRDDSGNRNAGNDKEIYSIPMSKESVLKFMEEGDYSSARSLNLFESIGSKLEDKIGEKGGVSLFLFSITQERVLRDFSVLQIAHLLSKRGKKVLIVDCDFIDPGLSGLVENVEEYGFLDLLLYGSSLKSVANPISVEGVNIIGPGSFPVFRTVPFAKKEFDRVNHFLRERSDVIIYCSTLYADDKSINPLAAYVDEIILSCPVEKTLEGRLEKTLVDLELSGFSSVKTISFGGIGDEESVSAKEKEPQPEEEKKEDIKKAKKGTTEKEETVKKSKKAGQQTEVSKEPADNEPGVIVKTEEIEPEDKLPAKGISTLRIVVITAILFLIVFIAWWYLRGSSIKEDRNSETINKAVQTVQEAGRDILKKDTSENIQVQTGKETLENEDEKEEAAENIIIQEPTADMEIPVVPEEGAADKDSRKEEAASEEKDGAVSEPDPDIYYSVHIASFRDINNAAVEAEYFEKKGYDVFVTEVEVKRVKWFRVLIGRFSDKDEAGKTKIELLSFKRIGDARVIKVNK